MSIRSVQDANARYSELVDTCLRQGPHVVTTREADTAASRRSTNSSDCSRAPAPRWSICSSPGTRGLTSTFCREP